MYKMKPFVFLLCLINIAYGQTYGRTDLEDPYYKLVSSGQCYNNRSPWALTTMAEALDALRSMSLKPVRVKKVTFGSAPYGTWHSPFGYVLNMVGTGTCSDKRKCLCWVGSECPNTVGDTRNPYSCRCGYSICDMNSYCVSDMSHCSPSPISACASTHLESVNGACACGTDACSNGQYCHAANSLCTNANSTYFKKWYGLCTDEVRSYTVFDSSNCIEGNIALHKGRWHTNRHHINRMPGGNDVSGCVVHDDGSLWLNEYMSKPNCSAHSECICWQGSPCTFNNGNVKNQYSCRCGNTICSENNPYCDLTSAKCYKYPKCSVSDGTAANSGTCSCGKSTCTSKTGLYCLESMGTCSNGPVTACSATNGVVSNAQSCACGHRVCPAGNFCDISEDKGSGQCSADGSWFVIKTFGKCTDLGKGSYVRSEIDCLKAGRAVSDNTEVLEGAYAPLGCYITKFGLYLNTVNYNFDCDEQSRCICKQSS